MNKSNSGPGYRDYPNHLVEVKSFIGSVKVTAFGQTIASTEAALLLEENRYPPVLYIPRADVRFDLLQENDESTYCPFKGEARYWNIQIADNHSGSAVWGYDTPYDEVGILKDYVAFYADRVDGITVDGSAFTA